MRINVQGSLVVVVAAFALLMMAPPAGANPIPPPVGSTPRTGPNTDITMVGTGPGQAVSGFIAPADSTFDPTAGYPDQPPADFTPLNEGFAGIIHAQVIGSNPPEILNMYCIDILTPTWPGLGYEGGTWDEADVPNVDYVSYILNLYYPNSGLPDAGGDLNLRAAAVQTAIWFLTDRYVLAPGDPVRPLTEAIVADALENGPLPDLPPPDLTIDPTTLRGAADTPLGPYVVTADSADTVTVSTASEPGGAPTARMYADAAATIPILEGAAVPSGQQIWLVPINPGAGTATLSARGTATVPSGHVYVYDGNTAGTDDAQKLILAQPAEVVVTVQADAEFYDTGSLVVSKTIGGPAAGQQGEIVIEVSCNDVALEDFVIPAGTTEPPPQTKTYGNIETPATCTVTETNDGSSGAVTVVTVNGSQTVDLTDNTTSNDPVVAEPITNTYEAAPGSLVVNKTVTGSAAGQQGEVVLHVSCDNGLEQDITIPAGATGDTSTTIEDLPAGTVCTVTETTDGSSSTVTVTIDSEGSPATIPAGDDTVVQITNTYEAAPGSLVVNKTVTGSAAGQQGEVVLHVSCDNGLEQDITIPAGATGDTSTTIEDLPAGTICTVTETTDGSSSTVTVTIDSEGSPATIPAGDDTVVQITNTYEAAPGSLVVNKTVTGSAAGQQGEVVLHVSCDNGLEQDITIPAGATGDTSTTIEDLPAGTICTVTETTDGSSSTVTVTIDSEGSPATIPAGDDTVVQITNTYEAAPGSLVVNKTVTGSAAGQQGEVVLHVSCDNGLEQDITIPAGATGDTSTTIEDLPAGTICTVTETTDGSSSTVTVTIDSEGSPATIPAGDDTVVQITNTYEAAPGSLVVNKTVTGSAAGQQGEVVLHVSCDNGLEQDITIPTGATGDTSTTIEDLPAGTICTVTETTDGSNSSIRVTITGLGSAAASADGLASIHVTDSYESQPIAAVIPIYPAQPISGYPAQPVSGYPAQPNTVNAVLPTTGVSDTLAGLAWLSLPLIAIGVAMQFATRRWRLADRQRHVKPYRREPGPSPAING